jgi:DNA-binding response OmpR family regulator
MSDKKHTILLVEDEPVVLKVLGRALEDEGFHVSKAENGEQGVERALQDHPDVILTDLKLPQMSGMDMIAKIRADEWGKKAEIVILSNASDVETLEEAMRNETFYYIVKGDSTMADVVEKVKALVKAHIGNSSS